MKTYTLSVKKLIAELKKMPNHLKVGIAMHDNSEHECAGWAFSVFEFDKENFDISDINLAEDKRMFNDMPERCVIISC